MSRQFPRLFLWHVARHARRHPLLAALNVLSVALGVAVYLAIGIANHSASESFAGSVDLVAGKANLEVRAPGGGFDELLLPKLAAAPGVRAATPVVEGYVTLPDFPGEYLQILGVDLFTQAPFATFTIGEAREAAGSSVNLDPEPWLAGPDALALSDEFARAHGLKLGDKLRVQVNGRETSLTVRFLLRLDATVAGRGNSRVGALDIGWAQEFLGKRGQLSGIQLLMDQPAEAERVAVELRKLVPADVNVAAPGQRSGQIQKMLGSFELNLGALSLISLLVGMFLIYNTIAASVVRRRVEVGILRAVGATRLEVQALFLGEAALFGIGGVLLGLVGGVLLARFLLGREIARVVSTLYALVSIDHYHLTPWLVGSAVFFGLGSVLVAAWLPAHEGARVDPVAALSLGGGAVREGSRLNRGRWLLAGLGSVGLALACSALALTTGPAWLGFGAAFFVLLGFAFTAPMVTTAGAALFEKLWGNHKDTEAQSPEGQRDFLPSWLRDFVVIIPRLAAQNLTRSLHRTAVIVAALMAAVAMTVGVSVMIHAFRETVNTWINRALQADLFLTPSANETIAGGSPAFFPAEVLAQLRTFPGVSGVETVREFGVNVRGERISMGVVSGESRGKLAFVGGDAERKLRAFYEPDRLLCSEPFARRFGVREGDKLPLPTPEGVIEFTVAGVYYDYSRDSGVLAIARENFLRRWHDDRVMSVALYLHDPKQIEGIADALRTRFNQKGEFLIFSNRAIRERVFEIFEQTFRVTGVLRGIAVVVAVIGIFLTLTTLVAEREREIGVLRAVGASRGQIQGTVLTESALIGVLSSALGLVAGLALAVVLVFVINKAFFGWSIQFAIPWGTVLATPLWIIPAAVLAGWGPAVRAGRVPIAAAVRAE